MDMLWRTILILVVLIHFYSCIGKSQAPQEPQSDTLPHKIHGVVSSTLGRNIDFIYQDKKGKYWIASNGEGLYCFDGKIIEHFTTNEGLCSNYVWKVSEDIHGKIWLETRDGICSFDGSEFVNFTEVIKSAPYGQPRFMKGGLFFNHLDGIGYYDGNSFTNFTISPSGYHPDPSSNYRPYDVYCTLIDHTGKVWFGTQERGVCVFDGNDFKYITGKHLDGPAVRTIFEDKSGILWFGNNGGGLFRYDGKALRNITEELGLGNSEFLKGRMLDKPGSMARIFAMNEDVAGNLWVGTVDAGVWRFDGHHWKNFDSTSGLSGNAVWVISRNQQSELWFVEGGNTIFNFKEDSFHKIDF